jgi:hypothetical protein
MKLVIGATSAQEYPIQTPGAVALGMPKSVERHTPGGHAALDYRGTSYVNGDSSQSEGVRIPSKTDLEIQESFRKKSTKKNVSLYIASCLSNYSREIKDDRMVRTFNGMRYCMERIDTGDRCHSSRYCDRRPCIICARHRMANDIRKYGPSVLSMEDPYFVTLTWQNVEGSLLWSSTREQLEYHRFTREKVNRIPNETYRCLRKVEVTAGKIPKLYNPHIHMIVDGKYNAEITVDRHIQRNRNRTYKGKPYVVSEAQDMKPCDSDSITETLKYCTKFVTKSEAGAKKLVEIKDLYTIFSQIHGRQMVRSFGLEINDSDEYDRARVNPALSYVEDGSVGLYDSMLSDWYDLRTGEGYSGLTMVN